MATEIELKYLVNSSKTVEKITSFLDGENIKFSQLVTTLSNCYFDTQQQALRQRDIGLRIRSSEHLLEQTIKLPGTSVGGLHQRPEYNVNISENVPQLALFPEHIWQSADECLQLQQNLIPIFNTNFKRTTWTLTWPTGSVIELAFDQGTICVGEQVSAIYELEIELVSGDVESLLQLAECLFQRLELRPGIYSKAARGYALWQNKPLVVNVEPLDLALIPLSPTDNINHAFTKGAEFCLQQLQTLIDGYLTTPSLACLAKIADILALLRHGFWLFDRYLTESQKSVSSELSHFISKLAWVEQAIYLQELITKTGNYRKKVEYSQQLLSQLKFESSQITEQQEVIRLFHSERFNKLQLTLLKLVLLDEQFDDATATDHNLLLSFTKVCLDHSLDEIMVMASGQELSCQQYLVQRSLLIRSLLTGSWFSSLYDRDERLEFRAPWLDIKHGLSELHTLNVLQQNLQLINDQPTKLLSWQQTKVESLLIALDNSRHKALSLSPYWRK